MVVGESRRGGLTVALAVALAMSACATRDAPVRGAPVENRGTSAASSSPGGTASAEAPARPVDPNAGKPGYYTVKAGDTLIRVGLDTGQNWRDIAKWNGIDNPNLIEVGQVLRVVPPGMQVAENGVLTRPVAPVSAPQAVPLGAAGTASAPKAAASAPATPAAPAASAAASAAPAPVVASSPSADNGSDQMSFVWPATGSMVGTFDESKNKGLDIAGKAGDAVLAAADGKVVYAGAGLRGYGNLIILKHNNTYLTAYAHNQALLVKEDQTVRKGQKVAEMGSSDADRVKLHFEIRRQGKPVDPLKYLPQRPAP
jgi:lipoprotein NlpD